MTIYMVYASIDYQGIDDLTIKLFTSKVKAEDYLQELRDQHYGDSQHLREYQAE